MSNKQKEADSQKELEREAALKHSFEELVAKNKEALLLEKQVKELEDKLQLAEAKVKVSSYISPLTVLSLTLHTLKVVKKGPQIGRESHDRKSTKIDN